MEQSKNNETNDFIAESINCFNELFEERSKSLISKQEKQNKTKTILEVMNFVAMILTCLVGSFVVIFAWKEYNVLKDEVDLAGQQYNVLKDEVEVLSKDFTYNHIIKNVSAILSVLDKNGNTIDSLLFHNGNSCEIKNFKIDNKVNADIDFDIKIFNLTEDIIKKYNIKSNILINNDFLEITDLINYNKEKHILEAKKAKKNKKINFSDSIRNKIDPHPERKEQLSSNNFRFFLNINP